MPSENLELPQPGSDNPNCIACGRCNDSNKPFILARGEDSPCDILLVGSFPTSGEDRLGVAFHGEYSNYLNQMLDRLGLSSYKIARTLSIRCSPNIKVGAKQHNLCRTFSFADITRYNPKLVILLGAVALRTVLNETNITNKRGTIIYRDNRPFLPVFHPGIVLKDKNNEHWLLSDLQQAKDFLDEAYGTISKKEKITNRYKILSTIQEVEEFTKAALACRTPIGYDTEFEPLDIWMAEKPICLGVSFSLEPYTGIFIPYEHPEAKWLPEEREVIKKHIVTILSKCRLIVHNAEPDVAVAVRCFGMNIQDVRVAFDTMRASMAIHGPKATHRLKNLAFTYADTGGYDEAVEKFKSNNKINSYGDIPLEMLGIPYAAGDTDTTTQIAHNLSPKIAQMGQKKFYYDVLLPSYRLNLSMRKRGLLVDWDEWAWRYSYFANEKVRLSKQIEQIDCVEEFANAIRSQKKKFSLKSGPQMQSLLFTILGVSPSGLKTESGADSLNSHAIKLMLLEIPDDSPAKTVLESMLAFAKATTFHGTFLKGIGEKLDLDGFLHTQFHNFTESTRRGSRAPNVQNFPAGNPLFKGDKRLDPFNMRMLLRARDGYRFVCPDWAQLEFRLAACYSKDANMITGSLSPKPNDAHTRIAKKFNIIRDHGKTLNFAIIYGASWRRIQSTIFDKTGVRWTEEFCRSVRKGLEDEYEDLFDTIKSYHNFIEKNKYVTTPFFGHVRLLPDIDSREDNIRFKTLREGWNHVVQCLGHDLLEVVMQNIFNIINKEGLDWHIVDDLHDGFLLEVPESDIDDAKKVCETLMLSIPKEILGDWLLVPLNVEIKAGTHFGDLKEI